jgi:hypothetical protein
LASAVRGAGINMVDIPDNDIIVYMKSQGIPIIDVNNFREAVEAIEETLWGWDVQGKAKAEQELKNEKLIICKLVNDWVQPYAKQGSKIPLVLFSTHPKWKTGTRFDKGLMEQTMIETFFDGTKSNLFGYTVLVFDENHSICKYLPKGYRWVPK